MTARAQRRMLNEVKKNPRVSARDLKKSLAHANISVDESTIRKTLNKNEVHGRTPRRKPLLSRKNIAAPANIGEDLLHSLSRDDIKDLFPGPANFLRRRVIWLVVNDEGKVETTAEILQPSPPRDSDLSNEEPNTSVFVTMSNPKYIVFTDSELELTRRSYFEQKRLGNEHVPLSKELFRRLIRNTMTNMISIARASEDCRYPSKHEEHVAKKLQKRLSNVRSPRKSKVPPSKKPRRDQQMDADISTSDYDGDSSASTIILERSPAPRSPAASPPARASTSSSTSPPARASIPAPPVPDQDSSDKASGSVDLFDGQKTQARHYRTLQEMYKSQRPNKAAVAHLMNLEFESRRRFITSEVLKEQDKPTKILEAYPCFRELDHVMDELQRIIQPKNSRYILEVKDRWETFYSKVQFYGVMKKAMKPPKTLNGVEHATAVFTALPLLFPSNTVPPRKLEDPETFLRQRSLSCPVVLVSEENCMIAVGSTPLTTFQKVQFDEGLLYLMAYYYAMHLTYPKCISTLLSVLQTKILKDVIHERDTTQSYKKAVGEWKAFIE
ncbi:hypothetical protein JOQ06_021493 [Pogonophryne albipinna]|uniref:Transposase Tc1-like domain-containing protein n=1 Tax=Pogonophryne albipinna TaxID=1090488 RepID=A0AAD6AF53_9TELE|nr:hypothetical protein JOQ06_021493 [Pogonophryne albipinna]